MYKASVIADSTYKRKRLTTFEFTMPKCMVAELNTSRSLSRNSASSRAIPSDRIISAIESDPFIPEWTLANKGMVAAGPLPPSLAAEATEDCLAARDYMIAYAKRQVARGVSKQDANRYLEPWMYTTIVATGTDRAWEWFFKLRDHGDADPKIGKAALLMHEAYDDSEPEELEEGEWHLPYIGDKDRRNVAALDGFIMPQPGMAPGDYDWRDVILAHMSAARCARISYLRQHEDRSVEDEVKRACELVKSGHWSPTEHQAVAMPGHPRGGNFGNDQPFAQFRHLIGDGY
jgi:thymidylate synthase ThyX